VKKCDTARQATDNKYGAEKMRFSCRITKARLQTLIEINNYLFYVNNSCEKTPQCNVMRTLSVLFIIR